MNIANLPLFIYLALKLPTLGDNLAVEFFLGKMGWIKKINGAFKIVFVKHGVPFVIKLTRYNDSENRSNRYDSNDESLMREFDMSKVFRGVPYLFACYIPCSKQNSANRILAFQPAVKTIIADHVDKKAYAKGNYDWVKRERLSKRFRKVFIDKGNSDCHEQNLGFDHVGRVVQFD